MLGLAGSLFSLLAWWVPYRTLSAVEMDQLFHPLPRAGLEGTFVAD